MNSVTFQIAAFLALITAVLLWVMWFIFCLGSASDLASILATVAPVYFANTCLNFAKVLAKEEEGAESDGEEDDEATS